MEYTIKFKALWRIRSLASSVVCRIAEEIPLRTYNTDLLHYAHMQQMYSNDRIIASKGMLN